VSRNLSRIFWISLIPVAFSGIVLFCMKNFLKPATEGFSVVNHPWQTFVLKLHILAAPFLLLVLGAVTTAHALPRRGTDSKGQRSGLYNLILIIPMTASGYLIQVSTSETFTKVAVWTHVGSSILFLASAIAHYISAREK
jgi:ABC-type molybdate transport system permease subunit